MVLGTWKSKYEDPVEGESVTHLRSCREQRGEPQGHVRPKSLCGSQAWPSHVRPQSW